jgi:CRP-like cAMP-binding protein
MSIRAAKHQDRCTPPWIGLLDADPDLGADLTDDERDEARRRLTLSAVTVHAGPWTTDSLHQATGVMGEVLGLLICSGTAAVSTTLAGRVCTRLLLPSDLILLDDGAVESIPTSMSWLAIEPTTIGVLDDRLIVVAQRWPKLFRAITRSAAQQSRRAQLGHAIAQLPRVEDRLLALLWSIADRCGTVRADGIAIRLPITHHTLAQMVGARRPTVTLGLSTLVENEAIRPTDRGWILNPDVLSQLRQQPIALL